MNKVITISREYGSGGRTIARLLADKLGYAYYDKEIIKAIADKTNLAEEYIKQTMRQRNAVFFTSAAYGMTPMNDYNDAFFTNQCNVTAELSRVLTEMAERSDCVIVGRSAEYFLRKYDPFRVFIYADRDFRLARRLGDEEDRELTEKEVLKKLQNVDKVRARYYSDITGGKWGARENYDLLINSGTVSFEQASDMIAIACARKSESQ